MRKRWSQAVTGRAYSGRCDICGSGRAACEPVRLGGARICRHCERAIVGADPRAAGYDAIARVIRRVMFGLAAEGV